MVADVVIVGTSERDAFITALYTAHAHDVRVRLRCLGIRNAVAVEDLVQDVFGVAFRRADEIPTEVPALWLLEVARKLAANYRRLRRHVFEVANDKAIDEAVDERAGEPDVRMMVLAAIEQLAVEEQETLLRHEVHGESLAEIGEVLGLAKGGVHGRVVRARRCFRVALSGGSREDRPDQNTPVRFFT